MKLERIKMILSGVWVVATLILGIVMGDGTWPVWGALLAVGLLPPLALLLWWNEPRQTMSESINEVRSTIWRS
jgi:hypothetical protein